jgi:hypothetical protein
MKIQLAIKICRMTGDSRTHHHNMIPLQMHYYYSKVWLIFIERMYHQMYILLYSLCPIRTDLFPLENLIIFF